MHHLPEAGGQSGGRVSRAEIRATMNPVPPAWVGLALGPVVGRQREMAFFCARCTRREPFSVPVMLPDWLAIARAFVEVHRRCRRRPLQAVP